MIYVEILETEETKEETTVGELVGENPIRQVRYSHVCYELCTHANFKYPMMHSSRKWTVFQSYSMKLNNSDSNNVLNA